VYEIAMEAGAEALYDGSAERVDEAIGSLTQFLNSDFRDLELDEFRSLAFTMRGDLWLHKQDPRRAIADYTAAIELGALSSSPYVGRATAYRLIGEQELAEADDAMVEEFTRRVAREAWIEQMLERLLGPFYGSTVSEQLFLHAIIIGLALALFLPLNIVLAYAQPRRGGGSMRRLLWVSAVLALLQSVPFLVASTVDVWSPIDPLPTGFGLVTILAFAANALLLGRHLFGPAGPLLDRQSVADLDDPALAERVERLATDAGLHPPRVQIYRSSPTQPDHRVWTAGLLGPALVIADGIRRMPQEQGDALITLGLTHIARGGHWIALIATPVAAAAAVVAAAFVAPLTAAALGLAVRTGLARVLSRRMTFACDRYAARSSGFTSLAEALRAVDDAGPTVRPRALLVAWQATTASPSCAQRIVAIKRGAPEVCPPDWPETPTARHDAGMAWTASLLWLVALGLGMRLALAGHEFAGALVLLLTAVCPLALAVAAVWGYVVRFSRRYGGQIERGLLRLLGVIAPPAAVVVLFVHGVYVNDLVGTVLPILSLVGVWLLSVVILSRRETSRLELIKAVETRDFTRAVDLGDAASPHVMHIPAVRHQYALALALMGARDRAIAELQALARERPRFKLAEMTLAQLLLADGQPQAALEAALRAATALPRDPDVHLLVARSYRDLDRLENAEAAAELALALEPRSGIAWAITADVALARGELDRAGELLQTAKRRAPGDAHVLLVEARLAARTGDENTARAAATRAHAAAREQPFAFLTEEAERLMSVFGSQSAPPA
jgi:tetratricopeptide (TPR) repeat protein